eukprot:1158797-Pelagomonas_calceolata.AAC.5
MGALNSTAVTFSHSKHPSQVPYVFVACSFDQAPPQETKQAPIIIEAVTPYSIFIEIFLDQIAKDPTHPAYQPQDATPKQIARGLWTVLNDEQKVRPRSSSLMIGLQLIVLCQPSQLLKHLSWHVAFFCHYKNHLNVTQGQTFPVVK